MAQRSPHQVVLSDEQRRELERRAAAYSSPHRDVVRAKAILLAAEGVSNTEIGERLAHRARPSRSGGTFSRGCKGLSDPAPGRPQRFPGAGRRGQGAGVRSSADSVPLALVQC